MFSCKFELSVVYETVFSQKLNESVRYELSKDKLYPLDIKINLPSDLDNKIKYILIESYILNYKDVQDNFHMYVNKGSISPTPFKYDYVTEEMKLNGQSILIEHETDKF